MAAVTDGDGHRQSLMLSYLLEAALARVARHGVTDSELKAHARSIGLNVDPGRAVTGERGYDPDALVTAVATLLDDEPAEIWAEALGNWQRDPAGFALPERMSQLAIERRALTSYRRSLNQRRS